VLGLLMALSAESFVPHAVAVLQSKGLWQGMAPASVKISLLPAGRPWVAVLSPPIASGHNGVVLKFGTKFSAAAPLAGHEVLSEAGVAIPLLGHGITEDGTPFTLEALAAGLRPSDDEWGDSSLWEDNAKLTAKLHQVGTAWFDVHRAEILEKIPLLKDEPLNAALWVMVRPDMLAKHGSEHFLPPADKLRQLLAALPRPSGSHAERLVTVHGDLHHQNILRMPTGESVLGDLEGVCVSSAVQDLVHVNDSNLIAFYLESMIGQKPSAREVDALWLEALIAEHVHFHVLRHIFWDMAGRWTPEEVAARMDGYIEHAARFASFAEKLRGDAVLAKKVMGPGPEAEKDWRGDCEAMMAGVLY